jgi:hypothetical protein
MKCHTNLKCIPPTHLPHTFSYIVAIHIHNHFESPNGLYVEVSLFVLSPEIEDRDEVEVATGRPSSQFLH